MGRLGGGRVRRIYNAVTSTSKRSDLDPRKRRTTYTSILVYIPVHFESGTILIFVFLNLLITIDGDNRLLPMAGMGIFRGYFYDPMGSRDRTIPRVLPKFQLVSL